MILKTAEAKVNNHYVYVQPNETMAINKFQRSRLTFQPKSLILESHQYIKAKFSQKTQILYEDSLRYVSQHLYKLFRSHDQDCQPAHIW